MADKKQVEPTSQRRKFDLRASTQGLPFAPGLYVFSVTDATPISTAESGHLPFPALLVASGPGEPPGTVEFSGHGNARSAWIYSKGDKLAVKVGASGATLIISSLRTEGGNQAFNIKVDAIDPQTLGAAARPAAAAGLPSLKLQIGLHLREQGDVQFIDADWAGRAGTGAWVEAFSIAPLETLKPIDIEYKGLSANGFETPWLSDGAVCGTKGVGMPLIGFAVRLKPQAAALYDCEYSAAFRSGVVIGPLRNGVPCRSKTAGDPLEAVQIRVIKRAGSTPAKPAAVSGAKAASSSAARKLPGKAGGPSFSKFREAPVEVPAKAKGKTTKPVIKKPVVVVPAKLAIVAAKKSAKVSPKPAAPVTKKPAAKPGKKKSK